MHDRLRIVLDMVVASLEEPHLDGPAVAELAAFSRDHLDRILRAATGETPIALRRRLLLERAAWELRTSRRSTKDIGAAAGYASAAAFSRAFKRAYGLAPSAFGPTDAPTALPAPNGLHFLPPGGFTLAGGGGRPVGGSDLTSRLVRQHLDQAGTLVRLTAALPRSQRQRPLRPGLVIVPFEGEEPSADHMAERLTRTLEIWVAAIEGRRHDRSSGSLDERYTVASRAFGRLTRRIAAEDLWDDGFVDALCVPPQAFTYGGVLAHVVTYGVLRREALVRVLAELGVQDLPETDPILWERDGGRQPGHLPRG